jgi:hypothetical protein
MLPNPIVFFLRMSCACHCPPKWQILSHNQASMSRELPDPLHVASEALDMVRSASEGMKGHPPLATDPLVTHMLLRVLVSVHRIGRYVWGGNDVRAEASRG